ncbi:protein-L-isoaspartate O-methyltransferase [Sphingomonas changnyeongensis]|uniref:Protein-L-isoaspartate O-methyltransferase n=1 Tax=Sphingomonas changnyeongensis TaxID=2698679 RepID=A0A7Z2S6E7_9SPHN|nr:protein-L-isoaspartate O-methyltransferase [Sphingomonas changnyeongensis]QHL91423.1 protein-L-isoaspartate O-methyltransferase [Sphingomonas changnyeongensis]
MTEQNYDLMRRAMVESQLRTTGVSDPRVVAAMASVPRERFVPEERRSLAYIDRPVDLGGGRALNLPEATGRLLTAAQVAADDRVLVVGAASGYAAALLDQLAGHVVALETDAALVAAARAALAGTGVEVVEGPLADGWAAGAPYDLIFIDGLVGHVPAALVEQLAEGGRLAAAIEDGGASRLGIGRRSGTGFGVDLFADCEAVRLPGFDRPRTFTF